MTRSTSASCSTVKTGATTNRRRAAPFASVALGSLVALRVLVHAPAAYATDAAPPAGDACAIHASRHLATPSATALQALASCHAKQGKTASAWAEHLDAALFARREKRADIEKAAKRDAAALEPRLTTLAVRVPPGWDIAGLVVRRDGFVLGRAAWGTAAPVDPGEHRVVATAPGKDLWVRTIDVPAVPGKQAVVIGPLEDAPLAAAPVGSASLTSGTVDDPALAPDAAATSSRGGAQRATGIVLGVIGLAGIGVGAVYGVQTMQKRSDVQRACPASPCADRDAVALNDDAKTTGMISTVSFAAGGGALLLGTILFFTAPTSGTARALRHVDVAATPAFSGVRLGGDF